MVTLPLLLLGLCALLPQARLKEEFATFSADELRNTITLRGREFSTSGDIVMDWSGSGFEFEVQGTSFIDATFVSPAGKIAVTVDGGAANRIYLHGEGKVPLVEHLDPGKKHTVKVYKDNEAGGGLCALKSITVDDGAILGKTPQKRRRFDFMGASITCGNQIDHAKNISAYGAFPRILSDMYDADYHSVCISGRGLMEGYNSESNWAGSNTDQLKDVYFTSSFYRDRNAKYDLSSYVPDVFVANVGDNDLGTAIMSRYGTTIESYLEEVGKFHAKVRALYPNTYILYMYGTYQNRWYSEQYRKYVEALDNKTGFEYMPFYSDGADNHPSYEEHRLIATRLANHLFDKAGLKPDTALDFIENRFEAEDCERYGFGAIDPVNAEENINLSEWHGVSNLGALHPVDDPEEIGFNGTALKTLYQEVNVSVGKAGDFELVLGYQNSGATQTCYVNIDEEEWIALELPKTQTGITNLSVHVPVTLSTGIHDVYITGPNTASTSVVYDYFALYSSKHRYVPPVPVEPKESSEAPIFVRIVLPAMGGSLLLVAALVGVIVITRKRKK